MSEAKDDIILHGDQYDAIKDLPNADKCQILDAMFHYRRVGDILQGLSPTAQMAFNFIRVRIDYDTKKYDRKCKRNKENANKRWQANNANASDGMRTNAKDAYIDIDSDIDSDIDIDNKESKDSMDKRKKKDSLSFDFVDSNFQSAFDLWVSYRKKLKKPYKTQVGIEQAYKELLDLSSGNPSMAEKIIRQSVAHEWQGLFKLANQSKPGDIGVVLSNNNEDKYNEKLW